MHYLPLILTIILQVQKLKKNKRFEARVTSLIFLSFQEWHRLSPSAIELGVKRALRKHFISPLQYFFYYFRENLSNKHSVCSTTLSI